MDRRHIIQSILGAIGMGGFSPTKTQGVSLVVGAWHVQTQGAPVVHHGFLFHQDGTLSSSQADGGLPQESDSNGVGIYASVSAHEVRGAFEEYRYARDTHAYLGHVRVEFLITLHTPDTFSGTGSSAVFDAQGKLLFTGSPTLSATRITL